MPERRVRAARCRRRRPPRAVRRRGSWTGRRRAPSASGATRTPGGAADLRFDRDRGWSGPAAGAGAVDDRRSPGVDHGAPPDRRRPGRALPGARRDAAVAPAPRAAATGPAACSPTPGWRRSPSPRAGAAVTHVDASRPAVAWARRNAELLRPGRPAGPLDRRRRPRPSSAREARRGRRYDGLVLDPPSYGHGPSGRAWSMDDLPDLLGRVPRRSWRRARSCSSPPTRPATTPTGSASLLATALGSTPARRSTAGELARRDRRTAVGSSSGHSRGSDGPPARRRGMMTPMASPTPPLLTSRANPRVVAVAALRDRRTRETSGLTVVDGAREVRRALEAGATVVEAFVCECAAGRAGRPGRARRRSRDRGVPTTSVTEPVFEKIAFGDRAEGIVAVVRIPDLGARAARRCRPTRSSWSSRASRSRATSARSCARPTAPGADAVVAASPRTDLFNPNAIRASAGTIFARPARARGRPTRSSPGRARRACGSSPPGSTPTRRTPTSTCAGPSRSSWAPRRTG